VGVVLEEELHVEQLLQQIAKGQLEVVVEVELEVEEKEEGVQEQSKNLMTQISYPQIWKPKKINIPKEEQHTEQQVQHIAREQLEAEEGEKDVDVED